MHAPPPLQADRLSLCSYVVTGQLLGGEVGSVVMFAIPKAAGQRTLDENFLQVDAVGGRWLVVGGAGMRVGGGRGIVCWPGGCGVCSTHCHDCTVALANVL